MLVGGHGGRVVGFPFETYLVTVESGLDHAERVLHQRGGGNLLRRPRGFRVGLLGRHDPADVLDMLPQQIQLDLEVLALLLEVVPQFLQVREDPLPFGVASEEIR